MLFRSRVREREIELVYFDVVAFLNKFDLITKPLAQMIAEFLQVFWTFLVEYIETLRHQLQLKSDNERVHSTTFCPNRLHARLLDVSKIDTMIRKVKVLE